MPSCKRTVQFLLSLSVLFISAAGCDFLNGEGGRSARFEFGATGSATGSTIDVSGGAGAAGTGGNGDQDTGIWLDNYGPAGVKIYGSGAADASFTLDTPAATPDFGLVRLDVTDNMSIPVYDTSPADNDVYYFLRNDSNLYHKIDDSATDTVTGIRVAPGATLTLGINSDMNYSGLSETAALALENDIEILGTLRSAAFDNSAVQDSGDPKDRGGLALSPSGGVFIRAGGVVSTAGDNVTSGPGGHGGSIQISLSAGSAANGGMFVNEGRIDASGGSTADPAAAGGNGAAYGGYGNRLNLYGEVLFYSTGTIRADGGAGGTGGQAGDPGLGNSFYVGSNGAVQNTGAISVSGGTGSNGDGGSGGSLELAAGTVSLHNSGAITARGGNGSANGGAGGTVYLYVNTVGDLLNSAAVDARGGDSTGTDDAVSTAGGRGGQIYFYAYGGRLISSGRIDADGGGVANGNAGSCGGQGGYVDIESYPDYSGGGVPAGAMEISGDILARGGAGPNGGYGGGVYMYYEDSSGTGGIVLRGYSRLVNNGGAGLANGGGGGGVWLWDSWSGSPADSAGVVTEADISANGGDADMSAGSGGYGGYIELWTNAGPPSQYRGAAADGGAGATPGSAGTVSIDGGSGVM